MKNGDETRYIQDIDKFKKQVGYKPVCLRTGDVDRCAAGVDDL